MSRLGFLISIFCIAVGTCLSGFAATYQTGDLIFQMGQTAQTAAIAEAQGSDYTHVGIMVNESGSWIVYEAVQPVKKTRLADFISRGKNSHFVVKRIRSKVLDMSSPLAQEGLKQELDQYLGMDYDIFFQWSDETIYCSELAFKAYSRALGLGVADLQVIGDLNLTGPNITKLIREREKLLGHPVDLNEPIMTPAQLMNSNLLELVQ